MAATNRPSAWVHILSDVDPSTRTATCAECGVTKIRRKGEGRWRCANKANQMWRAHRNHKDMRQATHRDRLIAQDGELCVICRRTDQPLYVDHSHATKKVRGLLCVNCNTGLGHLKDNPENLLCATEYLRERT